MWTARKIIYCIAGLLGVALLADVGAYWVTGKEEVLWCYLAFLSLAGCGFVLYLKMR